MPAVTCCSSSQIYRLLAVYFISDKHQLVNGYAIPERITLHPFNALFEIHPFYTLNFLILKRNGRRVLPGP